MKLQQYQFEMMPESFQFCSNQASYAFHSDGFLEFCGYCMINSQATPVSLELEQQGEQRWHCQVRTEAEMTAMSERCVKINGQIDLAAVEPELQIYFEERLHATDQQC